MKAVELDTLGVPTDERAIEDLLTRLNEHQEWLSALCDVDDVKTITTLDALDLIQETMQTIAAMQKQHTTTL